MTVFSGPLVDLSLDAEFRDVGQVSAADLDFAVGAPHGLEMDHCIEVLTKVKLRLCYKSCVEREGF